MTKGKRKAFTPTAEGLTKYIETLLIRKACNRVEMKPEHIAIHLGCTLEELFALNETLNRAGTFFAKRIRHRVTYGYVRAQHERKQRNYLVNRPN